MKIISLLCVQASDIYFSKSNLFKDHAQNKTNTHQISRVSMVPDVHPDVYHIILHIIVLGLF
jgi:hypothetical protein